MSEDTNQGTLVHQHNIRNKKQFQTKLSQQNQKNKNQRSNRKDSILKTVKKDVGKVVNRMREMFEPKKPTGQQQKKQAGQQKGQKQVGQPLQGGQKQTKLPQTGQKQTKLPQTGQKQTGQKQTGKQGQKQVGQPLQAGQKQVGQPLQGGQKQRGQRATVQKQTKPQTGQLQAGQQQIKRKQQGGQKQGGQRATVQKQTKPQTGQLQAGQQQIKRKQEIDKSIKELEDLFYIRRTQEGKNNVTDILNQIKYYQPTTEQIEKIDEVLKSKYRRFPKLSKLLVGGQTIHQMYPTYEKFLQQQK